MILSSLLFLKYYVNPTFNEVRPTKLQYPTHTAHTLAPCTLLPSCVVCCFVCHETLNENTSQWKWKVNPVYPDAKMVRLEILQLSKGLVHCPRCLPAPVCEHQHHFIWHASLAQTVASICPTLSLWFSWNGWTSLSKAYCGMPEGRGWRHQIMVFIVMWIASDFLEWAYHWYGATSLFACYQITQRTHSRSVVCVFVWCSLAFTTAAASIDPIHRCGHKFKAMWHHHKAHHVFFNPTPFAVIADEYLDQFMRSLPVLIFPMIYPVNMDSLYFQVRARTAPPRPRCCCTCTCCIR